MSADYHSMMNKGEGHLTLQAFKKQCQLISLKHPEIQTVVLEACGQPSNSDRVDWPVFIQVMAHLRYRSVSRSQQIAFWMQIFNKNATGEQVIKAENFRLLLT
jgi:Ca2+-binding EF-hand superfamily protein